MFRVTNVEELNSIVETKYAWPGGYEMYLIMGDCETLCIDCARQEHNLLKENMISKIDKQWTVIGAEVLYEDEVTCCHCNRVISA